LRADRVIVRTQSVIRADGPPAAQALRYCRFAAAGSGALITGVFSIDLAVDLPHAQPPTLAQPQRVLQQYDQRGEDNG